MKRSFSFLTMVAVLSLSNAVGADPWTPAFANCDDIANDCESRAQIAWNECMNEGNNGVYCQGVYNQAYQDCLDLYDECISCQGGGQAVYQGAGHCEGTCVTDEQCSIGYTRDTGNCNENVMDSCGCCQTYSPIVLGLSAAKPRFSSAEKGVLWDINGLGKVRRVAWPVDGNTAWLALDRNGNGFIDSGSELFGNTTPLSDGGFAEHGYLVLAEYDVNKDGRIDARDPVFASLRLWQDFRRNGICESGELVGLAESGILSLSLKAKASEHRDRWGNRFRYRAKVQYREGPKRAFSYDVFPVMTAP